MLHSLGLVTGKPVVQKALPDCHVFILDAR